MSGCQPTDQRGIALAVALFALVVIGALVSGSFFAGRLEQQSGQNTIFAAQALEAAEAGLSDVLANTDPAAVEALSIGSSSRDLGPLALGMGVTAERQIIRLTSSLWFVRSTGTRRNAEGNPLATRALGLLVRVVPANGAVSARFSPVGERAWVQLS
jgi:Tfp pilus assembly protein PilX